MGCEIHRLQLVIRISLAHPPYVGLLLRNKIFSSNLSLHGQQGPFPHWRTIRISNSNWLIILVRIRPPSCGVILFVTGETQAHLQTRNVVLHSYPIYDLCLCKLTKHTHELCSLCLHWVY